MPFQVAKQQEAKTGLPPLRELELNLERQRAPGWPPMPPGELRLWRPKEVQAALVVAGSGTKAQVEPGWILGAVATTSSQRAEAERWQPALVDPLARPMTVEAPEPLALGQLPAAAVQLGKPRWFGKVPAQERTPCRTGLPLAGAVLGTMARLGRRASPVRKWPPRKNPFSPPLWVG